MSFTPVTTPLPPMAEPRRDEARWAPPEPGIYQAYLVQLLEGEMPVWSEELGRFDKDNPVPAWRFRWFLAAYNDGEPLENGGQFIYEDIRRFDRFTERQKGYQRITAILGRDIEPGYRVDPAQLVVQVGEDPAEKMVLLTIAGKGYVKPTAASTLPRRSKLVGKLIHTKELPASALDEAEATQAAPAATAVGAKRDPDSLPF